jgi:hypothetical protein
MLLINFTAMRGRFVCTVFLILLVESFAFQISRPKNEICRPVSTSRRYNFFKDIVDKAFENDRNLSTDKTKGQYDAPGEEFDDPAAMPSTLTETQRKWRETQVQANGPLPELLEGTFWTLGLFLAGIPERDPSNDLYGSKVNISSRDKATGLSLPAIPSTTVTLEFLGNGICRASQSEFCSGQVDGEWKLSDDGKILRFSIDCLGYTKTVETKGSIQKIYWSDEDEKSVATSTTYFIPPGFVYADVEIAQGRQPGTLDLGNVGVLRVEQASGLFGISSKMVACGKFEAQEKQ